MADRYTRPDWVRRVNAMALSTGGAGHMVPLAADELIDLARVATGLDSFGGPDDPGELGDGEWEGRFRALVEAINSSGLHVVGRLLTRQELLRSLCTRLRLAELRRTEPASAAERIDAPVIVTGPARSGTTILFELLALDPTLRSPIASDVLHPAGLGPGVPEGDIRAATESEQELWADIQPEFAAIHELRSDLPVECITFTSPSFAGNHWPMILATLGDWSPDPAADFALHRAVLQAVQFRSTRSRGADGNPAAPGPPTRWVLKTPAYLMMLDDLLGAYPDASVIQTHRDPAKTMPSTVSTTAMVQWLRTDSVDLDVLSPLIGALFCDALARVETRRRSGELATAHPRARFGDVRFADLMADPVAAVVAAYDAIGRTLTDTHREAIGAYLAAKPRHAHGRHLYSAEDWGFDATALRSSLAGYMTQVGVAVEE